MMPTSGDIGGMLARRAISARPFRASGGSSFFQRRAQLSSSWAKMSVRPARPDNAHLLAQEMLPLRAIHLLLHPRLNLVFQLQHFQLAREDGVDLVQPGDRIQRLQDLLANRKREVHRRGDEVGEPAGLAHVQGEGIGLVGQRVVQLDDFLEDRQHGAHERFRGQAPFFRLVERLRAHADVGLPLYILDNLHPPPPLGEQAGRIVGHAQGAPNSHLGADVENVALLREVHFTVALGGDNQVFPVGNRRLDRRQRAIAAHKERHDHLREEDHVAQRNQRALDDSVPPLFAGLLILIEVEEPIVKSKAPQEVGVLHKIVVRHI